MYVLKAARSKAMEIMAEGAQKSCPCYQICQLTISTFPRNVGDRVDS